MNIVQSWWQYVWHTYFCEFCRGCRKHGKAYLDGR